MFAYSTFYLLILFSLCALCGERVVVKNYSQSFIQRVIVVAREPLHQFEFVARRRFYFSGGVPSRITPCVVNGAYHRRRKRMMFLPTNRHAALRELLAIREFPAGPTEDQRQLHLCRIRVQVAMRLDSIQENGAHVPGRAI